MAEVAGTILSLLETAVLLHTSLRDILERKDLSDDEKRRQAEEQVLNGIVEGLQTHGRVFFCLKRKDLDHLSSSVAVEELLDCYLSQCTRQRASRVADNGCLFAVLGRQGSGKTLSALSLLAMKHSRAPKQAIYFGGNTGYRSGDDYFDSLLDEKIGGGKVKLSHLSQYGLFSPYGLATNLLDMLPVENQYLTDTSQSRNVDIPGLRAYVRSAKSERSYGGTPVIIFDDVNIDLDKRDPTMDSQQQVHHWRRQLGKTGKFFDTLITQGYEWGIIVFVATRSLEIAQFFSLFNGQEKSRTLKPLLFPDSFKCQFFNWNKEKRMEFLKLQNNLKDTGERMTDAAIERVVEDSLKSDLTVREMFANFEDEATALLPSTGLSKSWEPGKNFWGWIDNCCSSACSWIDVSGARRA